LDTPELLPLEVAAAAKRAELSSDWPTAAQVSRAMGQPDRQPVEHFPEILAIMREHGTYLDENGRTTGWREVEWFLSPHVLLNGDPPYDVLRENPSGVLEAARVEHIEGNNSEASEEGQKS